MTIKAEEVKASSVRLMIPFSSQRALGFGEALRLPQLQRCQIVRNLNDIANLEVRLKNCPEIIENSEFRSSAIKLLRKTVEERDWNLAYHIAFSISNSFKNEDLKHRSFRARHFVSKVESILLNVVKRIGQLTLSQLRDCRKENYLKRRGRVILPSSAARGYDNQTFAILSFEGSPLAARQPRKIASLTRSNYRNWERIKRLLGASN